MTRKAKSKNDHLPDKHNAPKKTGKRAPTPGPADEEPNVKAGTTAAHNLSEQAPSEGKKGEQAELLKIQKAPTPRIQGDKMSAHFIGFRAHRLKNRTRVVTIRLSLELEEEHAGRVPEEIESEWKHFRKGGVKLTMPDGIDTQHVLLASVPDAPKAHVLDITANVPKAVLTTIVEKGKGAARKVTRLELNLLTTYTSDVDEFCRNSYDETVWLKLEDSQDSLFEDEQEGE